MTNDALQRFTSSAHASWGPLRSELVASITQQMAELLETRSSEPWLSALHEEGAETRPLFRDPEHGFLLLAHTEVPGLYRPPHDHGRGWVVYAVQRGETEMSTYARLVDERGSVQLVKRGTDVLRPGQVKVYLPGDIHDTRCIAGPMLLFRLTSCDLKQENVTRYAQRDGAWVEAS